MHLELPFKVTLTQTGLICQLSQGQVAFVQVDLLCGEKYGFFYFGSMPVQCFDEEVFDEEDLFPDGHQFAQSFSEGIVKDTLNVFGTDA